jgi:hypothetical protein
MELSKHFAFNLVRALTHLLRHGPSSRRLRGTFGFHVVPTDRSRIGRPGRPELPHASLREAPGPT